MNKEKQAIDDTESENTSSANTSQAGIVDKASQRHFKHEIFISHRGFDKQAVAFPMLAMFSVFCRPNFAFFDQTSLTLGESNTDALSNGVAASRTCLVVIGDRFFSSKWCIGEVEAFLKRPKDNTGRPTLIPLFYGLRSGECRHLSEDACLDTKAHHNETDDVIVHRQQIAKQLGQINGISRAIDTDTKIPEDAKTFAVKVMYELIKGRLDFGSHVLSLDFEDSTDLRAQLGIVYDEAVAYFKSVSGKASSSSFRDFLKKTKKQLLNPSLGAPSSTHTSSSAHEPSRSESASTSHENNKPCRLINVPTRNNSFVYRDAIENAILSTFENPDRELPKNWQVVTGIAGSGKTQLAMNVIAKAKRAHRYDWIVWFDAYDVEALEQQTQRLAEQLKTASTTTALTHCQAMLSASEWGDRLLVFDNAPDFFTVESLIPEQLSDEHLHILILSRSSNWDTDMPSHHLTGLSDTESVQLLKKFIQTSESDVQDTQLATLAQYLHHCPALLVQAAKYLHDKRATLAEWIAKSEQHMIAISKYPKFDKDPHPEPVFNAWQADYDQLPEPAQQVLHRLTLLTLIEQPIGLIKHWQTTDDVLDNVSELKDITFVADSSAGLVISPLIVPMIKVFLSSNPPSMGTLCERGD